MTAHPLSGKRVVITRPAHQASELQEPLCAAGAQVVLFPTISITDPADGGAALRRALARIEEFSWIVFTSANAVERTLPFLTDPLPARVRVAAIGSGTEAVLNRKGVRVDLLPRRAVAEELLSALLERTEPREKVLLPRAAVARDVLPEGLRQAGYEVEVVEAYRTEGVVPEAGSIVQVQNADVLTFTSSSSVERFVKMVPPFNPEPLVACIGPITGQTARAVGFSHLLEAEDHSIPGLARSLADYFT